MSSYTVAAKTQGRNVLGSGGWKRREDANDPDEFVSTLLIASLYCYFILLV